MRPLAYLDHDGATVCAGCVGAISVFACVECGSEEHPYGYTRCARCFLRGRLTTVLTDPLTGQIHPRLVPVFDTLLAGKRPQSTLWWLTKRGSIASPVLAGLAAGQLAISHDTFRHELPLDRRHAYLRELLTATEVLPPYAPAIERIDPWLTDKLAGLPTEQAEVLARFAHWHVLRRMRRHADAGTLTSSIINGGRSNITAAAQLMAWATGQQTTIAELSQPQLEGYLDEHPGARSTTSAFLTWLTTSRINTSVSLGPVDRPQPLVTLSDEARWRSVELLLHDTAINSHSRVAGLFTLLFAQPLNRTLKMTCDQVVAHPDGGVVVTFDTVPIEMPTDIGQLILVHMSHLGPASYQAGGTVWLFPGRLPGRPFATEPIRRVLVAHGIKPRQSRSAALFSLAASVPTPVLADLLGIARNTATRWAALAARDWSEYAADRASHGT